MKGIVRKWKEIKGNERTQKDMKGTHMDGWVQILALATRYYVKAM